jgi:hypothetical protein
MTGAAGSLAYAQARIGARWGARAADATWRRIEGTRGLAAVLGLVQSEPALASWVEGLTPATGPHAIEATLRRRWGERAEEVARWMPAAWQPALRWCSWLPDLALVEQLATGEPAPHWLDRADAEDLEPLLALAVAARAAMPRRTRPADAHDAHRAHDLRLATVAPAEPRAARGAPPTLPQSAALRGWAAEWHRLAPPGAGRAEVEAVVGGLLRRHLDALASDGADTAELRGALQSGLLRAWRRTALQPAAAFCHLGLLGLELLRLRGELVVRAALPRRAPAAGRAHARPMAEAAA